MRISRLSLLTLFAAVFITSVGLAVPVHAEPTVSESETYEEAVDHAIDLSAEAHADDHGAGHHHEEIEGLPQLDFSTYTSQIFWMFVAFTLLYVIFSKKSLPEISGAVETRRDKIESDLSNAKDLKEQAETVQAEYEAALHDARLKATETFKGVEDEIKANNNARLESFKDRANKLTQETESQLDKAKKEALSETQGIAAEIASIAAEKIIGVSTDIKQAETLVKNINKEAA